MDMSNWRPTLGASGTVGDSIMESGDWREQLQADSRKSIVNKIIDILKRHIPFSEHEGLQELTEIAMRFEEKIYIAATSQSEYLRKTALKILTMETRSQNPMSDPMQSNSAANSVIQWVPLDYTAQTGNPNGRDRHEEVYQKIKAKKDLYLRPTQGASSASGDPTMGSGDWRARLQADSRQRIVNKIMDTLKRHLPFSGHEGQQELKKIAVRFEEKIYTAATSQPDYLRKISLKMLTMETRSQDSISHPIQSDSDANSVNPSHLASMEGEGLLPWGPSP